MPEGNYSYNEKLRSRSRTKECVNPKKPVIKKRKYWDTTCYICTIFFPNRLLIFFGINNPKVQNAWREKMTLCILIFFACIFLGFLTYGVNSIVCKGDDKFVFGRIHRSGFPGEILIAKGSIFKIEEDHPNYDILLELKNVNCTGIFKTNEPACVSRFGSSVIASSLDETNLKLKDDRKLVRINNIHYTYASVYGLNYIVIDNKVYDASLCTEEFYFDFIKEYAGRDASFYVKNWDSDELACFKNTFYAGELKTKNYGCIVADFLLYSSSICIFGLIITRFILAVCYSWFMKIKSKRLLSVYGNNCQTACILLVTCYSEDEVGLKGTLNSLCAQEYNEKCKLIVVISDGLIRGSESDKTTPEILLGLFEVDYTFPIDPKDYNALAAGTKRYNQAKVYPGVYKYKNNSTKMILIVKTGNPAKKISINIGNRGKRDSQVILIRFFQRIICNDRISELEYDIYRKIKYLMPHLDPSNFEAILMVDADTIVRSDALQHMVRLLENDDKIMGMCGETRISNKCQSWVTMIQVFEYYISHHLSKSFESVFGGVTCLPGCFCLYKIQTFIQEYDSLKTLPLIAHPFILNPYSIYKTETLHQKNLLLLGEDRYLTTLLLKNFEHRKLIFCPAAKCETQVPAEFKILLSQRRRWINSTIHNLFELIRVNKLCGTFCCSMQFVVLMELMGTLVLPAAILFTFVLIGVSILVEPAWIPLIMLFGILGLPAFLIALTTFELSYLFWILIYIISLPIWNFILPLYAFWHFDDFSWGDTRKIANPTTNGHLDDDDKDTEHVKCNLKDLSEFQAEESFKFSNIEEEFDEISNKKTEQKIGKTSERNSENITEFTSEGYSIKLSEQIAGKASEKTNEKILEQVFGKILEQINEEISKNTSGKASEQIDEKIYIQKIEKIAKLSFEQDSGNTSENINEEISEQINKNKPLNTSEESNKKSSERISKQDFSKTFEKINDKISEPASKKDFSKTFEKINDKISEQISKLSSINESGNTPEKINNRSSKQISKQDLGKTSEKIKGKISEPISKLSFKQTSGKITEQKISKPLSEKSSKNDSKQLFELSLKQDIGKSSDKINEKISEKIFKLSSEKLNRSISEKKSFSFKQDSEKTSEETFGETSEEINKKIFEQISKIISQNVSGKTSEQITEMSSDQMSKKGSDQISEKGNEQISKQTSGRKSVKISGEISEKTSKQLSGKSSENTEFQSPDKV